MTLKAGSGVTIVTCNFVHEVRFVGEPKCQEEFRSFSAAKIIPKQLEAAGWGSRTHEKEKQHFCPAHAAKLGLGADGGVSMPDKRNY